MGILEFPLIRLGLFFLCGILLSPQFTFSLNQLLVFVISTLLLCIFFTLAPLGRKAKSHLFGIACTLLVFSLGVYAFKLKENRATASCEAFLLANQGDDLIRIQVGKLISETDFYLKYNADAQSVRSEVNQKILLRIKKDSLCEYPHLGRTFISSAKTKKIPGPLNPNDFDYASFMRLQGIQLQLTASFHELIPDGDNNIPWKLLPAHWQQALVEPLRENIIEPQHFELLAALLFGHKTDLSPDTKKQFATAGVMHLLAVSGLHLGIVMLFAKWFFGFLKRVRNGQNLRWLVVFCVVWGFALLTGASVSVLRAATLFSFLIVGKFLGGRGHSLNSLFASMWLLLLINPFFAFQVGFQLSYLAVFYILWLMPSWTKWHRFKNLYMDKAWQMTGLSLIAQLATAPLSLYYFTRFPSYFLLSNLLLLPMMGVLLIYGFISVLLITLFPMLDFLLIPLEAAISIVLNLTRWVESLPYSSLRVQPFEKHTLICFLLFAVMIGYLFRNKRQRLLPAIGFTAVCLALLFKVPNQFSTSNELILMNQFGRTQLVHQQGKLAIIYEHRSRPNDYSLDQLVKQRSIRSIKRITVPSIISYKKRRILIVDGSYDLIAELQGIDILLLTQNAQIHLERWIRHLKPKLIIADGSSFPSIKRRWEETAKKRRLPFYDTSQKGAYVFE